jgi:hypothetical protein
MKALVLLFVTLPLFAAPTPEFAENLKNILTVQENVLSEFRTDEKAWGDWKLDGQKTDLAVSKSGLLGFSAVKGTAAVELSWSRADKSFKSNEEVEGDVVTLDSAMNEKEVIKAVRPTFNVLFKNKKKGSYAHIQKNMEDHIIRYHRALKGIDGIAGATYTPKKFRLDLSTSFSSPLFGFAKLSGDTRMRLEWKITPSASKNLSGKDQEVVKKLIADLTKGLEDARTPAGYKLKEVSIGLGLSKKNLLSFSKVKGEIVGELYFKRNTQKADYSNLDLEGEYGVRSEEKFLNYFKRRRFRKGIRDSFKLTNWFAGQFKRRNSQWEVGKFKTSFSLSYSGFLGLANTSSKSLVTFTYSK